ncbi:MAG: acetyl-CoA carboxylase biotin carboxyl carrier protein [Acidobacteria bacterium]|nr:acetyl-CoA carboxylase biotin carboxyl carrier protein [Acidobacteriota bacterium]
MNSDDIKELLELVQAHDLAEFELEDGGFKLRVKRGGPHIVTHVMPAASAMAAPPAPASGPAPTATAPVEDGTQLAIVKSPIVGTFYRSAEPGAAAFVNVGDTVKKGQVLCIIEAMKLMNEIDSEYEGEITNVYVENGQPVQYGERIFAIRLRS